MSTPVPPVTIGREALVRDFEEFKGLIACIREAVNAHGRGRLVATNTPLSPGILMSALLSEAATVCVMWGDGQQLRPEAVEDVFNQALRNARQALRGLLYPPTDVAVDAPPH